MQCAHLLLSYHINSSMLQSDVLCLFVTTDFATYVPQMTTHFATYVQQVTIDFATYVQQVTTWNLHLWIVHTSARCWDTTLRQCFGTLLTKMQSVWLVLGHYVIVLDTDHTYLSGECIGPHITTKWGVFLLCIWKVLATDFSLQRQAILTIGFHCFRHCQQKTPGIVP
jgi:hypothetical protein